jgi:SOS response regulatory protein OraA/RecX
MYEIIKQNISVDKDGLFLTIAKLLGFNRTGKAINERFEGALNLLSKHIEYNGQTISINNAGEENTMALIKCPECGKMISDKSSVCIGCGYPTHLITKEPNITDSSFTKSNINDSSSATHEKNQFITIEDNAMVFEDACAYLEEGGFSKKGLQEQLEFDGYSREEANSAIKKCNANWLAQAVMGAKSYLDTQGFSKKGLQEQLEYDGFESHEAKYATENCGANWETQAIISAKAYLEMQGFSKQGLQEQLEYDGFEYSEAEYATNNCGADWKTQAVRAAKGYLEFDNFSKEDLIDQLEYDGFSHIEARYGANEFFK